jgi:serine O-acetyltransferase
MARCEEITPGQALRRDLARYWIPGASLPWKIRRVLNRPEIWNLCLFRWGSWIYGSCPGWLRPFCRIVWKPWSSTIALLTDTHIGVTARIGPGFFIGHCGGIWINPRATLGSNCNISQGAVIGGAGAGATGPVPTLGDRVWVGPHAVITGGVRVGNDSVVGANSLVVADVPEKGVVVGVPAKVLSYSGSERLIHLPQ